MTLKWCVIVFISICNDQKIINVMDVCVSSQIDGMLADTTDTELVSA